MVSRFKSKFEPGIGIIAKPFLNIHPNTLTLLSLLFSILFFFFLGIHNYTLAVVCYLGNIFDAIDGYVARHTQKVSAFGGFLDSTLDRICDFLIISAFGVAHLVSWEIVVLTLCTSFLVSYSRSRGEQAAAGKIMLNDGYVQRSERLLLILAAFLLYLIYPQSLFQNLTIIELLFLIVSLFNVVTVIQRIHSLFNALSR